MHRLTIGRAAREAGVNLETIRFYERKGLIERPQTPSSGFRTYDEDVIRAIRFIKRAQEIGFTLAEVKELLSLRRGEGTCATARAAAERKLTTVEEKIDDLQAVKRALKAFIADCRSHGDGAVCPLLETLDFTPRSPDEDRSRQ